ncbi:beta-ketoacyl-ACP synthase II [bacterium]|nr:beta-ketoacyl-ACP synthase II [bacterium]
MNQGRQRVVVTGMGVVTPLGSTVSDYWSALTQGKSGIRRITMFDPTDLASQIAGEVQGFDPEQWFDSKKEVRKADRFIQYALAASLMAVHDAGLVIHERNAAKVGVLIGSGIGGIGTLEDQIGTLIEKGPRRISPFMIPMVIANLAGGHVSIRLGAKGPNLAIATACAAGGHAIGEAAGLIRQGYADCMIAGGSEACVTKIAIAGFNAMKALSTRNDEPERASRPFDRERDGFIVGDGAGILVLERLETALDRGATTIYGELIGYGLSADAYHISAPCPDGTGAALCMAQALKNAGIEPGDIDYINAHGTSTPYNDKTETLAIKTVFAEQARHLCISSTKSMTGHLLGGAGGIEAVASLKAIQEGIIPPTINLDYPDPECDLDFVPHQARLHQVRTVMSNSFGFGGTNASLIFRKYSP